MEPYRLCEIVLRKDQSIGWRDLKSVDSRISMKSPNAVSNFCEIYPRTKIMEMGKAKLRKTNINTEDLLGKPKGKTTERDISL